VDDFWGHQYESLKDTRPDLAIPLQKGSVFDRSTLQVYSEIS